MADRRQSVAGSTPAALAPVLGANRDGSATADSSSGLLVTVMGEFVLPGGGAVWTQTLVATMEQLGVQGKATRQALARMEKRAWLKRDRVGRRTRWLLTDAFSDLLAEGAERIYGFGMNPRVWDGRWLVVLASVPERDRNVRYRMGLELNWVGMGSLGQGLWICPWVEHEPAVTDLLQRLGVRASSFRAELGSLGSGPDLVAEAWDLPDLADRYHGFLAETESLSRAVAVKEHAEAATALAGVVHHWRRFPFLDPDLPHELLPSDWPGPAAARRFAELRAVLTEPARCWWSELDASYDC
ncbi:MAG: PaaX family transcriptional regulator [Acidimicrobiia bacterium]|nr:PaaX family transcriptional regulator [Acidimicrobiia bacterium]